MDAFISIFLLIWDMFKIPLNVYGFTFSFWDVFLFTVAASIILRFIGGILYD